MLAFYKNITVSGRLHFRDVDGDLPVLSLGLFASTKDGIVRVGRFARRIPCRVLLTLMQYELCISVGPRCRFD